MPESVPLPLRGQLENARQLERQVDQIAKRASKNLKIDFTGSGKNIDALSQPLGRITGKADEFTKSMEAANARVIAFGASVGILTAVTQGFKALVSTTIEVEKSLAKINSILNANASGLERLKGQIFDIAKNTEQTFDTVSQAALELSRQGLSATEVTKRLNDSLILSRLSGVDAAEAVGSLTAAVNGFSKSGLTTSEILNKVSAAANKFAVSERDLFEGFKRSASVAQQAGVSLDELGGIITAVQQKTARGGAVIGNSLKTIFTRIGKEESVSLLRDLGVEVANVQGNLLPATQVIENLAKGFDKLSESQQRQVAFKIGGGFQIAPLLAALQDYSEENSIAVKATETFSNATDEAYKKNIILNKTLSASIQTTKLSVEELANALGELGVTDVFGGLLSVVNNAVKGITDILQGDGIGSDFARGFVKGVSGLILPAIGILAVIIGKLSIDLIKFGANSLKTFAGIGNAAERLKSVEERTYQILLNNEGVRKQILTIENASISAEQKKVLQSELFTKSLLAQKTVLTELQQISSRVAPGIVAGVGGTKSKISRSAGGFLPVGAEQRDINSGVGGAPRGSKPVVIPNFAFGGGQKGTMVANSSEYIVPNYAGGGSAIFNQDMVKSMGLPSGAKKVNAAGGYIPNFASKSLNQLGKSFVLLTGKIGRDSKEDFFAGVNNKGLTEVFANETDATNKKLTSISRVAVPTYQMATRRGDPPAANEIEGLKTELEGYAVKVASEYNDQLGVGSITDRIPDIKKSLNPGALEGFAGSVFESSLAGLLDSKEFKTYTGSSLNSRIDLPSSPKLYELFGVDSGQGEDGAEVKSSDNIKLKKSAAKKFFDVLSGRDVAFERKQGSKETNLVGKKLLNKDAIRLGFLKPNKNGTYTVKQEDLSRLENESFTSSKTGILQRSASGYIPNFAQNQSPLEQAIGRERDAGVPINQIRINQNGKLRNSQNPSGIAVTNTRDEPTGAIPNFVNTGAATRQQLFPGSNFSSDSGSDSGTGKKTEDATGRLFALSTAAFVLQGAFGSVSEESEGVGKVLGTTAQGLTQLITTLTLFQGLGTNLTGGKFGEFIKNIGKKQGDEGGGLGEKLSGLLPIVGQLTLGFQVLNTASKAIFDVDLVTEAGLALGFIKTPAQEAAASLDKLNTSALGAIARDGLRGGELKGFVKDINTLLPDVSKLGEGRKEAAKAGGDKFNQEFLTQSALASAFEINRQGLLSTVSIQSRRVTEDDDFGSGAVLISRSIEKFGKDFGDKFIKGTVENLGDRAIEKDLGINRNSVEGLSGFKGSFGKEQQNAQTRLALGFASLAGQETREEINKAFATSDTKLLSDAISNAIKKSGKEKEFKDLSTKLAAGSLTDPKDIELLNTLTEKGAEILQQEKDLEKVRSSILKIRLKTNLEVSKLLNLSKSEAENQIFLEKSLTTTSASRKFELAEALRITKDTNKANQESSEIFLKSANQASPIKAILEGNDLKDIDKSVADNLRKTLTRVSTELGRGKNFARLRAGLEKSFGNLNIDEGFTEELLNGIEEQIKGNNKVLAIKSAQTLQQSALNELSRIQNQEIKIKEDSLKRTLALEDKTAKSLIQQRRETVEISRARRSSRSVSGPSIEDAIFKRSESASLRSADRDSARIDVFKQARENFRQAAKSEGIIGNENVVKAINSLRAGDGGTQTSENLERVAKVINKAAETERAAAEAKADKLYNRTLEVLNKQTSQVDKEFGLVKEESQIVKLQKTVFNKLDNTLNSFIRFMATGSIKSSGDIDNDIDNEIKNEIKRNPYNQKQQSPVFLETLIKQSQELRKKEIEAGLSSEPTIKPQGSVKSTTELFTNNKKTGNTIGSGDSGDLSSSGKIIAKLEKIASSANVVSADAPLLELEDIDKSSDANKKKDQLNFDTFAAKKQRLIEITKASSAAEIVLAEQQFDKNLRILKVKEEIAEKSANLSEAQRNGLEGQKLELEGARKIAEIESERLTLRQKLASEGLTPEASRQSLEDTYVSAAKTFTDTLASGLNDAIVKGGDLGDVLRSAASDFFSAITQKSFQNIFQQIGFGTGGEGGGLFGGIGKILGFNQGGIVNGGSGSRDDVPAMLTGGEYVIKKSAVNKYGPGFMESINAGKAPSGIQKFANGGLVDKKIQSGEGGFFVPGTYGGTIQGKQDLLGFASQSFTSGRRDTSISGSDASGGYAGISLEAESVRLTNRGRKLGTPLQQATRSAKEQAFGIYGQQLDLEAQLKEQEKARKKAFKNQLIAAGISITAGALASGFSQGFSNVSGGEAVGSTVSGGVETFTNASGASLKGVTALGQQGFLSNPTLLQKFGSGFKGSILGGGIPGVQGSFGGLKNIFSARGGISNEQQLFDYVQKNPNSDLAKSTDLLGTASRAYAVDSGPQTLAQASGFSYAGGGGLPQYRPDDLNRTLQGGLLPPRRATGGYVSETAGVDTVPTMLSGGEFVMNSAAADRVGKGNLEKMNSGVSGEESKSVGNDELLRKLDDLIEATKESTGEINITVNGEGGREQEESSGEGGNREFAKKLKEQVVNIIEEEKRLGGSLRNDKL